MVCTWHTLFLKTLFVFFQAIVAALESLSIDNVKGDVPEMETGKGSRSPVVNSVRLVAFTMLIEQRLRRRCSYRD
jgi:hypothetical protein